MELQRRMREGEASCKEVARLKAEGEELSQKLEATKAQLEEEVRRRRRRHAACMYCCVLIPHHLSTVYIHI